MVVFIDGFVKANHTNEVENWVEGWGRKHFQVGTSMSNSQIRM